MPRAARALYEGRVSSISGHTGAGEAGLRQLLGEMRSDLSRFMLARRCDPADVEDLLQDLYVKLASFCPGPVSNPRAYLYQTANNLLHDQRRGRARQLSRDDRWARRRVGSDLEKDAAPSPEQSAIARDDLARVNELIGSMPDRTALILKMYRLDGISQKDIAHRLGLSLSAVEKHLQRAYQQLLALRRQLDGGPSLSHSREADDAVVS